MNNLENNTYILIDKFHSGQASSEEVAYLHEWKSNSQGNAKLYNEILHLLELIGNLKDWKEFDNKDAWTNLERRIQRKPLKLLLMLSSAAAILLFVFAATFSTFSNNSSFPESMFLTGSQHNFTILDDGSELFLSEASRINIGSFSKESRILATEGNYFVNVAHDKSHPFTIRTNKVLIKVLGTSFKVEEDSEVTKVKVRDGKVLITNIDGVQYTVRANESFSLQDGNVVISKITDENWGLYARNFEDEPISKVLDELSSKFGHLSIHKRVKESACRITTKIGQSTIIEILEEIDLIFNLDYTIKGGEIVVNNISC